MTVDAPAPARFLAALNTLDQVSLVALGASESLPDLTAVLPEHLVSYLETPEGRRDLAAWQDVFADTLAALSQMRALILSDSEGVTLDDLARAESAVRRCFQGLTVWLNSAPAGARAS